MVLLFLLERLMIIDCTIELDADVEFCGLQSVVKFPLGVLRMRIL